MEMSPEGRKPVSYYTVGELRKFLVTDAVKHHATYLPWFIEAILKIGKATAGGQEAAYQAIVDEVHSLTGSRAMPLSAAQSGELKAMGL